MFKIKNYDFVAAFSVLLILGACSSKEPTFGEMVVDQGASMQNVGENWNDGMDLISDGKSLVKDGKKNVEEGTEMVKSGNSDIREGQNMISSGQRMQIKAEGTYQNRD